MVGWARKRTPVRDVVPVHQRRPCPPRRLSLPEFTARYASEDACRAALFAAR